MGDRLRFGGVGLDVSFVICDGGEHLHGAVALDRQRDLSRGLLHLDAHHGGAGHEPSEGGGDDRALVMAHSCFLCHRARRGRVGADVSARGDRAYDVIFSVRMFRHICSFLQLISCPLRAPRKAGCPYGSCFRPHRASSPAEGSPAGRLLSQILLSPAPGFFAR